MISQIPNHKQLILFDGICNLCNGAVQYVIKYDKRNRFIFAPLQGKTGQQIIEHFNIDTNALDSILLYTPDNRLSYKSSAVLKIASRLGFPRNLLAIFFIVPPVIRNWIYDYIAINRYNWFGKKEDCMIPTPEFKRRFLD
ncbi:thiol-disulfide oxidoreductase DCC family protein [Aestuariivivens sp. NBU2969]|uniref:thiol-disulfide oxidoreductase DCC family protein n=1 Tax=Aestuariivivens sp. NBU2969 TaxID=2873267 RepID=UPI001CBDA092|nr:DCC1-like thiol-disulfide oxidoreductase family protein [Aestuariivivens sp. NBU2969]